MRKQYIDNLRWMSILLLFPYHTFTLYNNWGEAYYVHGVESPPLSLFVKLCQPWFMPLLFVLAGASTLYALDKRNSRKYLMERISKLLIPLMSGLVLLVPVLTYFAERFHNSYAGGYLSQYLLFFSKTDLVGYYGGFTPAHLWFLAYLFVISVAALPLALLWKRWKGKRIVERLPVACIVALFLPVWLCSYILDINGKSIGRYFSLYLLGVALFSQESILHKLEARRKPLSFLWGLATVLSLCAGSSGLAHDGLFHLASWTGILALLGLARHFLNFQNRISTYFTKASFALYIFHLPWIVAIAYFIFPCVSSLPLQILIILVSSFLLTLLSYEAAKRIPLLRRLFAIRKP